MIAWMALAIGVLGSAFLGIHGLQQLSYRRASIWVRLDECVGKEALRLRDVLNSLESSNIRIEALRVSIEAASEAPPLQASLKAALQAQVLLQEMELVRWRARTVRWNAGLLCGERGERAFPNSELPFRRNPPDPIGPQKLEIEDDPHLIHMIHGRLESFANVKKQNRWKAGWGKGTGVD